ncbi:MAG: ATP-binding protein [Epsilonproteobacteria bacterium]|nr:ATP-binding protein [Campylobacterota bacterium]
MNLLETLYETKLKNTIFYDRKIKIQYKKTILFGPRKSGKTHLVIDYLQKFEQNEWLYIDFDDVRVDASNITLAKLNDFIKKYHIKILVLDNFDFSFTLPKCDEIIITTDIKSEQLDGFYKASIYPLDFEEFIAFDQKHFNIEQLFNIFSNKGGLPEVVLYAEENIHIKMQKLVKEIFANQKEFLIFKKFCELQSTKISLYQIFSQLKSKIKISKDFLYSVSQNLQDKELIYLLKKYKQEKSTKKVYIFDFAIKNGLTFKKDFLKRFENMVFLELYKREKFLYYSEYIDFFIEDKNEGVICSPFMQRQMMKMKMKSKENHFLSLKIKKIWIITLGNEGNFIQNDINYTLIPFWNWVLQN